MTTPHAHEADQAVASNWCKGCGRMKGVGCACGLSFKEKMKSQSMLLPANFRAVKG